jgi:hypothetical protein
LGGEIMKKLTIFIFILFTISLSCKDSIKTPKSPDEPSVLKVQEESKSESKTATSDYNVNFQNQKGSFGKGKLLSTKNFALNLVWDGNESGGKKISIDNVKTLRVKGYTPVKKVKDKLGFVFYYPYMYDLELKDGTIVKNAKGNIKELESFTAYSGNNKIKCYTYFMRYWLEDKKMFNDNKSKDFNEKPKVPGEVVIYIEFKG